MAPNSAQNGADIFGGATANSEMGGLGITAYIPNVPAVMEAKNSVKAMLMKPKKR